MGFRLDPEARHLSCGFCWPFTVIGSLILYARSRTHCARTRPLRSIVTRARASGGGEFPAAEQTSCWLSATLPGSGAARFTAGAGPLDYGQAVYWRRAVFQFFDLCTLAIAAGCLMGVGVFFHAGRNPTLAGLAPQTFWLLAAGPQHSDSRCGDCRLRPSVQEMAFSWHFPPRCGGCGHVLADLWDKSNSRKGQDAWAQAAVAQLLRMVLGHLGLADEYRQRNVVSNYALSVDVRMAAWAHVATVGDYQFVFYRHWPAPGCKLYRRVRVFDRVCWTAVKLAELHPEKTPSNSVA